MVAKFEVAADCLLIRTVKFVTCFLDTLVARSTVDTENTCSKAMPWWWMLRWRRERRLHHNYQIMFDGRGGCYWGVDCVVNSCWRGALLTKTNTVRTRLLHGFSWADNPSSAVYPI